MFEHIVEQEQIKNLLKKAVLRGQVSHAYLFTGPKGIGKKMLVQAFAAVLRCTAPVEQRPCGICKACKMMAGEQSVDVLHIEPEAGSRTIKIKQIRELINCISEKTFDGNTRVCMIFGAEKMTAEAQNALLKSLEEPHPKNVFLLTAENTEKLLPTIRSRCQVLSLKPLSDSGIGHILGNRYGGEEFRRILEECGGIPGKALEMIENNDLEERKKEAFSVIYDILKGDPLPLFSFSERMGKEKAEGEIILSDWIGGFESLLRAEKTGEEPALSRWKKLLPLMYSGDAEKILDKLFSLSERLGSNVNARLQWESTLLQIYRLNSVS